MSEVTPTAPPAIQESHLAQEAIITEAITTTAVAPIEVTQGGSISFDEQMVNELLGQHSDPSADMPFIISGLSPVSSSSMQTTDAPSQAQSIRDEEILAEINAELEAAGRSGNAGSETAVHSPAPLRMVSPGGTVVDTHVFVPSSVADPVPPTPSVGSMHLGSSSEEDVDIMPPAGEQPSESKPSKRRISVSSESEGEPLKRRPKKKK